jgi:hypothetical protein
MNQTGHQALEQTKHTFDYSTCDTLAKTAVRFAAWSTPSAVAGQFLARLISFRNIDSGVYEYRPAMHLIHAIVNRR